jgi:hypothetical protein
VTDTGVISEPKGIVASAIVTEAVDPDIIGFDQEHTRVRGARGGPGLLEILTLTGFAFPPRESLSSPFMPRASPARACPVGQRGFVV